MANTNKIKYADSACSTGTKAVLNSFCKEGGIFGNRPILAGLLVLWAALVPSVFAQTPPDAGSLLRDQQQMEKRLPDSFPGVEQQKAVKPEMKPSPGVKIILKEVRFTGIEGLVSERDLQALVKDAIGQEQDFAELQSLADRVTKYLKSKGFFLARAYLPKQDITEGVVEIAILPGRLEGKAGDVIDVRGKNLRIPERKLKDIAAAVLIPNAVSRTKDMERALLLMNDLPGVSARSTLGPGSVPGTSRLMVEAEEGPLLSGSFWLDNYGNRYNGIARINGLLNINDPFGLADQINLLATVAEDLETGMLSYSIPVGSHGLKLATNITWLHYKTGKELSSLRLEGSARSFTARVIYPVIRARKLNVNAVAGYDRKAMEDEAAKVVIRDKRVDNFFLNVSGNRLDGILGGGLTGWSIQGVTGSLDLSRVPGDLTADQASSKTNGSYNKLTYSLGRLQKLPSTFSFYAGIHGQFADQNLDSSEEFSLGGPYGVRAYPASEGAGDEGWLANFELRYDVPKKFDIGNVQLLAFFDTGETKVFEDPYPGAVTNATGRNRYHLNGAGCGATLLKLGSYSVRAVLATTIDDNPGRSMSDKDADGKSYDNRFWVQTMVWF